MMKRLSFVTFLVALAAIAAPAQIRDDTNGHSNAQVEIRIEHVSAQTANVIFVITSRQEVR